MNNLTLDRPSIGPERIRDGQQKQTFHNVHHSQSNSDSDTSGKLTNNTASSVLSSDMRGTTRHTIFSEGPSIEQHSALMPYKETPDTIMPKPHSPEPNMDLSSHAGQPAKINLPRIGGDLASRLEGLKQYKVWSERIHKEAQQHSQGKAHVVAQSPQVVENAASSFTINTISASSVTNTVQAAHQKALPVRPQSESIDTCLHAAPTPFSSPAVIPVKSSNPVAQTPSSLVPSASPPSLDLPETAIPKSFPLTERKCSIVISSTSTSDLIQQSRSRSRSQSGTSSTPRRRDQDKKYPPVSFPKYFHEHETQHESNKDDMTITPARRPTPSTSPMTKPRSDDEMRSHPQAHATPHDKRGRPVFYTTIHHYTECPHASPPATRPLDPNAQPRQDPNFHPTNPAITRSVIPGHCFNCDTMHRRAQENVILDDCTTAIARFKDKLVLRLDQLDQLEQFEAESSDTEAEAYGEDVDRLQASVDFPEDEHDLRHQLGDISLPPLHDRLNMASNTRCLTHDERSFQARLVKEIRQIEAAIDTLRAEQDSKVKAIWAGYTRRWGPATLGVQRGNWASNSEKYQTREDYDAMLEHHRRSIEERLNMPDEIEGLSLDEDGSSADDVQIVPVEASLKDERLSCVHSRSRSTSPRRATSRNSAGKAQRSISRGSESTVGRRNHSSSIRDSSAALTPGEGKMQISWHR